MEDIYITSFAEFHDHIDKQCTSSSLFRGISNIAYPLIPKIGRKSYCDRFATSELELVDDLQDLENKTLSSFVKMAVPYIDLREKSSWDVWAIGQHFGLPTRFLDWTENPLIAAYFAVENNSDCDCVVYITDKGQFNQNTDSDDPLSISDEIVVHEPSYIDARIIAQKGLFTVHRNPVLPLDETEISGVKCVVQRLIIKKDTKLQIMKTLDRYGINRSFIYPGLDGLAAYLDNVARHI
jgi:hypothetical protein